MTLLLLFSTETEIYTRKKQISVGAWNNLKTIVLDRICKENVYDSMFTTMQWSSLTKIKLFKVTNSQSTQQRNSKSNYQWSIAAMHKVLK